MKKSLKKELNSLVLADIKNAQNLGLTDEGKRNAMTVIRQGINAEAEIDRVESETTKNKELIKLEREKLEFEKQLKIDRDKKEQELREKELEHRKDELKYREEMLKIEKEKAKSEHDDRITQLTEDKKFHRTQAIIAAGGAIATALVTLISKGIYAALTVNAQKHDYENFEVESNSSKEQRNNLLNK